MAIVTAYRDGHAVQVPEHWIGHPSLGEGLTRERPPVIIRDCCGGGAEDEGDSPELSPTKPTTKPRRNKAGDKEKADA